MRTASLNAGEPVPNSTLLKGSPGETSGLRSGGYYLRSRVRLCLLNFANGYWYLRARSGVPDSSRSHPFLSHHSPNSRNETQRPLPTQIHYPLPPINRIHEHKPSAAHLFAVSPDVSTRLFQTYFSCIHPLWPILYKPLYASLDYASPADMMPPALVAAVYAIALCVDMPQPLPQNTIVQRSPEPREFFEEALYLLQSGNGESGVQRSLNTFTPSITNCQVLAILLLQQHGLAEYERAAMLCGLASAMAIDLRIHRPCESSDPIQAEVQSRLWWNLFILEKILSSETGKPVLLRAEETDCPYPSVSEADEFELTPSYGRHLKPLDQVRNTCVKLRTISVLHTSVRLAFIMERISREIYGLSARKAIRQNQAAGETKRMDVWMDLREWERDIEASPLKLDLSDDLTSVPGAITNYVVSYISLFYSCFGLLNSFRSCGMVQFYCTGHLLLVGNLTLRTQTLQLTHFTSACRRRTISA